MSESKRPRPTGGKPSGNPATTWDRTPNRGISSLRRGDFSAGDLGLGVRLVHEDEDLLVVDKPTGLVTAPMPGAGDATTSEAPSVFAVVKRYVRSKKRRNARAWIVHRLDKEASGLLVFAKNETAFEWLKEDFRARRVHRIYVAVVETEFPESATTGTIQNFLGENERGIMQSVSPGSKPRPSLAPRIGPGAGPRSGPNSGPNSGPYSGPSSGPGSRQRPRMPDGGPSSYTHRADDAPQLAVTHYRVLACGLGRALVQLRLGTGRKNQIRVHMSEAGHPLVGDYRYRAPSEAYGAPVSDPISRLCLHAVELGITHPSKGETMRFSSPAPEAFWGLVGAKPRGLERETLAVPGDEENRAESSTDPKAIASNSGHVRAGESNAAPSVKKDAGGAVKGPVSSAPLETSWDHVAPWYENLLDQGRSDHHRDVIVPGTLRLLRPARGMRVLDVACGQGLLCRRLEQIGVEAVGVDASPRLIDAARRAMPPRPDTSTRAARFEVGDARTLGEMKLGLFDAAASVMALMNIDPLEPVIRGCAALLKPGGVFVGVILHPAFRAPGQTSWGFDKTGKYDADREARGSAARQSQDEDAKKPMTRQYRRVDGYLSAGQTPIVMNPGHAAHGKTPVTTWTFHRPVQTYIRVLSEAGFLIETLEEWPSLRQSQPGPQAREENRIRREIPMFLGFRAIKRG